VSGTKVLSRKYEDQSSWDRDPIWRSCSEGPSTTGLDSHQRIHRDLKISVWVDVLNAHRIQNLWRRKRSKSRTMKKY